LGVWVLVTINPLGLSMTDLSSIEFDFLDRKLFVKFQYSQEQVICIQ
jgi:hypothetical protein